MRNCTLRAFINGLIAQRSPGQTVSNKQWPMIDWTPEEIKVAIQRGSGEGGIPTANLDAIIIYCCKEKILQRDTSSKGSDRKYRLTNYAVVTYDSESGTSILPPALRPAPPPDIAPVKAVRATA